MKLVLKTKYPPQKLRSTEPRFGHLIQPCKGDTYGQLYFYNYKLSLSSQLLSSGSAYHKVHYRSHIKWNNRSQSWNMAITKKKTKKIFEAEFALNTVQKGIFILALLSTTYQPCLLHRQPQYRTENTLGDYLMYNFCCSLLLIKSFHLSDVFLHWLPLYCTSPQFYLPGNFSLQTCCLH